MAQHPPRFAVLGSGSWGTAFAKVLADAGCEVTLWARRREVADAIEERRENPDYLPGVRLPDRLVSTSDPRLALDGATAVVLAVPSQTLRHNLTAWRSLIKPDAMFISLAKGVELGTLKRMSEVIIEVTGVEENQVAVVSGPNLAQEIAAEQPTATVIACTEHARAVELQHACTTGYFRPYTITDVIGCELGGACKNVIALSCGMAAGLGYGSNTQGTLITRGLAETARLGAALGADPLTLAGLAGLGDLVATCLSPLSRNRVFGERLGRGQTPAQALAATHGQVAEGVKSCSAIRELALKHGVEMPITEVVHRVCHDGFDPREMAADLIGRKTKPERQ
ncbi:MAG TPA: NAD(P)H-dependent glycerol-3-phosphate dehydrogenase [Actinophytocola sp.]|uniref:NAD(P)H-dependent glycerol-3-phosphate dehydrogenase n=1 Tax=Actinophytocola sp. TaxID=1872138 RepID=UPI002DDCE925|nr:NAD(P)H-dependent glycerol-3-phosphate dehydrogenase [Actinophytocola sp.]HEV2781039.1 NAD(P)H-dependent glycerol-3-phosphate dehydrogenase [Actinophytocola sp.]